MKLKKILALAALGAVVIPGLTSCGSQEQPGGAGVVQIKCYKGGYGDEWIRELIARFNETFASQNMSAVLVESSAMVTEGSKQEIYNYKKNQIDLYFTNGSDYSAIIDRSQATLKTSSKTLLAGLDDVLDSKGIGLDGKEEEQTLRERLFDGITEVSSYNGNNTKWQGKVFKLPWADAMTGLFANTSVLNKYGIDVPLTSDEFASAIEKISTHTAADNVYPYSWGGNNCPGYWSFLFETWFAQYSGVKKYENFQKCQPETGTIKDNGYEVYQDIGIKKSLEAMYPMLQLKYSPAGSASKDHTEAQVEFMTGKSAFFVNGDWVMNEMKEQYAEKSNEIVYVQMPILSSIGTENGLTDAQLHDVVKGIDEGKSDGEIQAVVPAATNAALAKIRDARSIHCSIGAGHDMFVPSYSDALDATKTFIRFMYSNDGCNIFREKAWGNLPIHYTVKDPSKTTGYQASLDKVYSLEKTQVISDNAEYNSIRSSAQIYLFNYSAWQHPNAFKNIMINHDLVVEGKKPFLPENMFETEAQYVKDSWKSYMEKVI